MNITDEIIQSIDAGILLGRDRFVATIPNFDPAATDDAYRNFIVDCVQAIPEEWWNPRAVQILCELIIIGMYTRANSGGNPFDIGQNNVIDFADHLSGFIYCWSHGDDTDEEEA